jgi:endonuclease/exonuclease/phosphatase family metal-dependent hydrolase
MRKVIIGAFVVFTSTVALTWTASCLTPYISPVRFWPMAFLALIFPYLVPVFILVALLWVFINKKIGLLLFLLFFVAFQNLFATFGFNPPPNAATKKPKGTLRILSWNVRGFDIPCAYADSPKALRRQMLAYISEVKPDILCLQEFSEYFVGGCYSNTEELQKRGYVYFYKTNEITQNHGYGPILTGSAIFSKIPITDTGRVMLGDPSYPEYLASADIILNGRPIRIYATHFKSINLFAETPQAGNRIILYGDSNFVYHKSKFEKLKAFAQAHSREAVIAKNAVLKSPFPVVIGTDMNSVPASYQYNVLARGLQDAFKLKGWGLGTTMDSLPKTLRIDYLLVDKQLSIKNFRKDNLHLSDHYHQFIDVSWKE